MRGILIFSAIFAVTAGLTCIEGDNFSNRTIQCAPNVTQCYREGGSDYYSLVDYGSCDDTGTKCVMFFGLIKISNGECGGGGDSQTCCCGADRCNWDPFFYLYRRSSGLQDFMAICVLISAYFL